MILAIILYVAFAANAAVLPPGKGKAIVQRECSGCHALKVVTSKRANPEQWSTLVNQMVSRGADVADEDIETVVQYLAKNFDETRAPAAAAEPHHRTLPVNVNNATAAQLTRSLGLSPKESAAIVSYRKENGNFKQWNDLTKIPGVEAKKIERLKGRLAF
jgi:competence protein ComEA